MSFIPESMARPKAVAKNLHKRLTAFSLAGAAQIKLAEAQEAVARMMGHADWYALNKAVSSGASPSPLDDALDRDAYKARIEYQANALATHLHIAPPLALLHVQSVKPTGCLRKAKFAGLDLEALIAPSSDIIDFGITASTLERAGIEVLYPERLADLLRMAGALIVARAEDGVGWKRALIGREQRTGRRPVLLFGPDGFTRGSVDDAVLRGADRKALVQMITAKCRRAPGLDGRDHGPLIALNKMIDMSMRTWCDRLAALGDRFSRNNGREVGHALKSAQVLLVDRFFDDCHPAILKATKISRQPEEQDGPFKPWWPLLRLYKVLSANPKAVKRRCAAYAFYPNGFFVAQDDQDFLARIDDGERAATVFCDLLTVPPRILASLRREKPWYIRSIPDLETLREEALVMQAAPTSWRAGKGPCEEERMSIVDMAKNVLAAADLDINEVGGLATLMYLLDSAGAFDKMIEAHGRQAVYNTAFHAGVELASILEKLLSSLAGRRVEDEDIAIATRRLIEAGWTLPAFTYFWVWWRKDCEPDERPSGFDIEASIKAGIAADRSGWVAEIRKAGVVPRS